MRQGTKAKEVAVIVDESKVFQDDWAIKSFREDRHAYAEFGAYELEWPIFVFADNFGNLFVYNA